MISSPSRMLSLLSLLQTRRPWPGHVLAERLDVTPRTVRRDVDKLRELGYEITAVKGRHGGYQLAAGADLPPLLFDDEQAVAIAVALGVAPSSGVDLDEAAARALGTLRQVMPARLRHRIDNVRFIGSSSAVRVDPAVLEVVSAATREQRTLRADYGGIDQPPRHLEPHAVVARNGRWYLVAWDLGRDDWRLFRLDRLTPRPPGGVRFTPRPLPTGDARSFLAARSRGSDAADRWPCIGEIVVELPVGEVGRWIGDGEVEELSENSCLVVAGSWSWTGLLALVLRLDAPFTVVGPPPLQAAAARLSARLAAAAGTTEATGRPC
jgi:predicted DNA-binding transcriptional regulator YafY